MQDQSLSESTQQGHIFGVLHNGKEVRKFSLSNKHGMQMTVLNYGAIINSLQIPVGNKLIDVVLGFDSIDNYVGARDLPAPPYFGAVIGRYSGRIKDGVFKIGEKEYWLNANNGSNTLHGGRKGFDQVLWEAKDVTANSITFAHLSKDGNENFPGDLEIEVTYTLTAENDVLIEYTATPSEDTIINITQHSYFNLDGHDGNVCNQLLMVNSESILEIDSANIPSGKFVNVADKAYDFRQPKPVPDTIDDSFVISDISKPAATLTSSKTGLRLSVFSDQPSVHLYVGGNLFGKMLGKDDVAYHPHSGICFESQNYPDAPNHPNFPNAILRKRETYNQTTVWKFDQTTK